MARPKKKKKQEILHNPWFWVGIAAVLLILIFNQAIIQAIQAFIASILAGLAGGFTFSIGGPTNNLPPEKDTCSDYNLYVEYVNYVGQANMNMLQQACISGGGEWTGTANQVSCHLPSTVNIDCSYAGFQAFGTFCQYLKATYTCSNITKFVGCTCNVAIPDEPLGGQDDGGDQGDEYTCGWHDSIVLTQQCGGTCPPGEYCEIKGQECACFTPEELTGGVGTVFVSSAKWSGAMGGLGGMDEKCQVAAQFAGLEGTWKAIASDSSTSASARLPDVSYYTMDGLLIANSKADLFDGSIANPINRDENNLLTSGVEVWTGTDVNGNSYSSGDLTLNCHNWGWTSDGYFGVVGNSGATNIGWIENTVVKECKYTAHIYCARVN